MSDETRHPRGTSAPRRRCVVVLGMHRSGTSAIARYIADLGFELPGPALPAHPTDNPDGYWEPRDLMLCNNRFMETVGFGWKDVRPIPPLAFSRPEADAARNRIRKILETALRTSRSIVIKDPRLCRLGMLYSPILEQLFDDACIVHVVRNPESVFQSLAYRATVPDITKGAVTSCTHAHLLWLRYNLDAEYWQTKFPVHRTTFESWLADPENTSARLRDWLRGRLPEAALEDPAPPIRTPRSIAPDHRHEHSCEAARISQSLYDSLAAPPTDRSVQDRLRRVAAIPIPDNHQKEVLKPAPDLVAAAYCKHITGLVDFRGDARRASARTDRPAASVVFISDRPNIPCHIYRVKNMVDALGSAGVGSEWFTSRAVADDPGILGHAKLVVIHRSFWSDSLAEVFSACRRLGIPTAGDIDDLIFDERLIDSGEISFISGAPDSEVREWRAKARSFRCTLLAADFCIGSTPPIREHLMSLGKDSICIPNGFGTENAYLSAHWHREFSRAERTRRICYASGSMTHDEDFESIAKPLSFFLARNTDWTLTIVGSLGLRKFSRFFNEKRLEIRPLVAHVNLAYEMARVDINVIPLLRNRFNDAKSPLKWYEAALCGVPSVATENPMYRDLFRDGSGRLAGDAGEWLEQLNALAESPGSRDDVAGKARDLAMKRFGPGAIADKWQHLLSNLD